MSEHAGSNTLVTLSALSSSFVKQRLDGFYKTCSALSEFASAVTRLHSKIELWSVLLKRFSTSEDELILPTVYAIEEALRWLEREEDRLQQQTKRRWCCIPWSPKSLFPHELTSSFQKVVDAIEGVPLTKTVKEEAFEARAKARQHRIDSIATLRFSPERKYVPISKSLQELRKALEAPQGNQVVVLYGPPGMGKSMLAQYLGFHYQETRQQSDTRDGGEIACVHFADGVFYLECGPDADSRAKHLELLHVLGDKPEPVDIEQPLGLGEQQILSEFDIQNRLKARLSGQSALVILDDVWNGELVQQLLVPEGSVKYLITTRERYVWDGGVHVKTYGPDMEEARNILANYVGGQPQLDDGIRFQMQSMVDAALEAAEYNPLVIANYGMAIRGDRSNDPGEWKAAKEEMLDVEVEDFDSFSGPIGLGNLMFPKTAASSTIMAIDVLPSEAQTLLLLASICSGPSIPDPVLNILFESLYGTRRRTYQKWRNLLEDNNFIQVQSHPIPWRKRPIQTWSVNRCRQYFIRGVKKESVSFLIQTLLGENPDPDADLVVAFSAIYGVDELRLCASRKLGIDIKHTLSLWRCVEPFVWLLEVENGDEWEQQSRSSAKQVIFQFIRKGRFAQNDLLRLLLQPQTSAATCWALHSMACSWSTMSLWGALANNPHKSLFRWTLKNKGAVFVFKGVLDLLRKDADICTHRWAANALVAFAWASHDITLPASSIALRELVTLLDKDCSSLAREAGARALGKLAHLKGTNSEDVNTVGEFPGVVNGLVRLLARNVNSNARVAAAETLYLLGGDKSGSERILGARGAFQKLADILGNDGHPDAQHFALLTLYSISCHNEIVLAHQMRVGFTSLQDVDMSTSGSSAEPSAQRRLEEIQVQNRAATTFPGILRALVGLLQAEARPVMQMLAASTLRRLAEVDVNRMGIAKFPGALEGLVCLLYVHHSGSYGLDMVAQAEATETLMILAEVDPHVKQLSGVVEGLQGLLDPDIHPYVQERAARALTIIDPIRANQTLLHSGVAYRSRASANIHLGLFHQALDDLDMLEMHDDESRDVGHELRFVKTMLGDYAGALAVADMAVDEKPEAHFDIAERGVLKRLMGKMKEALLDLDRAIDLAGDVYEYIKQRGYVRYLIGDEQGAILDASTATKLNYDGHEVQTQIQMDAKFSLCEHPVAFLGYTL